jgi:curved DNA-binding protein CbpA
MARFDPDPYLILGIPPTATHAEITHAYRDRLRAHHPDTRHTPSSQIADEHLRQVLAAYALLRDPARRADYDRATSRATAPPVHRRQKPSPADDAPAGGVQIPVTHHATTTTAHVPEPPLRAGPVRRH